MRASTRTVALCAAVSLLSGMGVGAASAEGTKTAKDVAEATRAAATAAGGLTLDCKDEDATTMTMNRKYNADFTAAYSRYELEGAVVWTDWTIGTIDKSSVYTPTSDLSKAGKRAADVLVPGASWIYAFHGGGVGSISDLFPFESEDVILTPAGGPAWTAPSGDDLFVAILNDDGSLFTSAEGTASCSFTYGATNLTVPSPLVTRDVLKKAGLATLDTVAKYRINMNPRKRERASQIRAELRRAMVKGVRSLQNVSTDEAATLWKYQANVGKKKVSVRARNKMSGYTIVYKGKRANYWRTSDGIWSDTVMDLSFTWSKP